MEQLLCYIAQWIDFGKIWFDQMKCNSVNRPVPRIYYRIYSSALLVKVPPPPHPVSFNQRGCVNSLENRPGTAFVICN